MSLITPQPPLGGIQQWEAVDEHLTDSLTAYINSCVDLPISLHQCISHSKDLISRMDAKEKQLIYSGRILARARNMLAATFYGIPEAILSDIFTLVMLDREQPRVLDLEQGIRAYYRRLYSLLGVCSLWYQIGVLQSRLWILIPMLSRNSTWMGKRAAEISLDRAKGRHLHLAVNVVKRVSPAFMDTLAGLQNRFHTINITADNMPLLDEVLGLLLQSQNPQPLSELSVYCPSDPEFAHFYPPSTAFLTSFSAKANGYQIKHYLPFLRVLRLRGFYLHWQDVTLTRLVELRVQSVTFSSPSTFATLVASLATAPQLRKLEIISVTSHRSGIVDENADTPLQVHFPNLETLHVEDLYSDMIRPVILSISPGSHHVSLYITRNSLDTQEDFPGGHITHDLNDLLVAIEGLPIHTLMLSGELVAGTSYWNWLDPGNLHDILRAIPSVTTLRIHEWDFSQKRWQELFLPLESYLLLHTPEFPDLRNLYLTKARIHDINGLKDVVFSHSLRKLVIGATLASPEGRVPLQGSEDLVHWLRSRVPDVRIIDHTYEPLEFQSDEWQLW